MACWEALGAVTASIPKEMQPSFVRCLKVGLGGACWWAGWGQRGAAWSGGSRVSELPQGQAALRGTRCRACAPVPERGRTGGLWYCLGTGNVLEFAPGRKRPPAVAHAARAAPFCRTPSAPLATRSGASGAAARCWFRASACPRRWARCCPSTCRACCRQAARPLSASPAAANCTRAPAHAGACPSPLKAVTHGCTAGQAL